MANEFKIRKGLIVTGASGGTVVDIQGSQGQLFSVTDDLSGSIFAVSDISGVPIFDVNSSGISYFDGSLGIGTANPSRQLEVVSSSGIVTVLTSTTGGSYISMEDSATTSDSQVRFGAIGDNAIIKSGGATALSLNTSQNAIFAGDVTVSGGDLTINSTGNAILNVNGTANSFIEKDTGTDLYIANNVGDKDIKFRVKDNTTNVIALTIDGSEGGDATFAAQAFATTATSSGDASSTLTTKGYVDGLITASTAYRGTWNPDKTQNSGYGVPDLSGVTQTSGYYYICSAVGIAEPNGLGCEPNSWAVGDWVVWSDDVVDCAGTGTGGWQKIDNSSVLSGVGTGQTVALWEGAGSVTDSETLGNAPITVSGNNATFAGTIYASGNNSVDWSTAYQEARQWDGGNTNLTASTGRVSLGATTIGDNMFTLANPGAITFPRFNADNTISPLAAAPFRTAIGAAASTALANYVTIATAQTITGAKTIDTLKIGSANKIQFANNDFIRYEDATGVGRFHFDSDGGTNNSSVQAATFVGALSGNATTATSSTTQAVGNNSTLIATTAYADAAAGAVPIGNYVTLATAQTISGAKTFNNDVTLNNTYLLGVDKLEANKIVIGTDTSSILGDVGIGTTSPDAKLHVANEASFTSGQSSVEVVKLQRINTGGDIKATTEGHVSMYATDSNNDTEWARMSWVNDNSQDGGLETEGALSFWTSQAGTLNRAMYIDHDQNVGIGTTTPLAKLDIQGTQGQLFSVTDDLSGSIFAVADISGVPIFDVNSSGVSYFDSKVYINATASIPNRTEEFQVTGTQIITNTGTNSPALYLGYNSSGSNSVQLGRGRTADGSSYIDLNGEVMAAGDYGFRIRRGAGVNAITDLIQVGTGSLTINALNGADTVFTNTNVGIGVTSSATKLDISVTPSAPWMKLINANETAFNLTTYNNGTNNGSSVYAFKHGLYYGSTENAAVTFYRGGSSVGGFLTFTTNNGAERMRIDSSGNVGIGVTTTSYKLEVDGLSKISGNVIIGTDPSTYANLTLKDATTTGSSSKSLHIISQNSGRSFLSLVTAGTGEAQIGFGTSQYASQNTSGSIQYTQATSKFTFKTNYALALTIANNQAATFTSTVTATNFILSSDKTLKNNIKEIDTNHIDVDWKNFELKSEPGVKRAGVIAQELEEKHPEFVRTDGEGMKSVAYIDLLITKIAELEARLEKAGI